MKIILIVSLFFLVFSAQGEEPVAPPPTEITDPASSPAEGAPKLAKPKGRQKQKNNLQPSETSSFIGDSENLDSLNAKKDNIKDDDEPILEDIKDVLNADLSKKDENLLASPNSSDPTTAIGSEGAPPAPEMSQAAVDEKNKMDMQNALSADDPDTVLEKKFHTIYQRYNKNPTSDEVWSAANSKQTVRVYEVQKGDTLSSISQVLFGDPQFWPKLWALNKQGILNPHFINPKMKIYFYEGDENFSPTLSVGQKATNDNIEKVKPMADNFQLDSEFIQPSNQLTETTDSAPEQTINESLKVARKMTQPLLNLPSSLPEGRNLLYFGFKRQTKVKIDLSEPSVSEIKFKNNIVITDDIVSTSIKIKDTVTPQLNCREGRVLKTNINEDSLLGADIQYDLYEQLDGFKSTTGHKHAYRKVATANSYRGKFLRINDCLGIFQRALVVLEKEKMLENATQKTSELTQALVLGSPEDVSKKFYSLLHYAFIDFGTIPYDVGQDYKTISDDTQQVNGEFRIIEKYGSYAVVVVTSISDLLQSGDRVATQEELTEESSSSMSEVNSEVPATDLK